MAITLLSNYNFGEVGTTSHKIDLYDVSLVVDSIERTSDMIVLVNPKVTATLKAKTRSTTLLWFMLGKYEAPGWSSAYPTLAVAAGTDGRNGGDDCVIGVSGIGTYYPVKNTKTVGFYRSRNVTSPENCEIPESGGTLYSISKYDTSLECCLQIIFNYQPSEPVNFVHFTIPIPHGDTLYGSVSGQSKAIHKLYGSVNGQSKEIKKLYGSVNGLSKRIY